jgi:hypothetical protein
MTNTRKDTGGAARQDQVELSGLLVASFPGLKGLRADTFPLIITSTELIWSSTATKTSRKVVPFNYKVVGLMTQLNTAPIGSAGKRKFVVGTATDDDCIFTTGAFFFNSSSSGGVGVAAARKDLFTATDVGSSLQTAFCSSSGTCGQMIQFKTKPTATALSTVGSIFGIAIVIPRF